MDRKCIICGKPLNGQQRKYCSNNCKQKDFYSNHKNNSSFRQMIKSSKRKIELIELKGGKCERCGYNKNLSALEFHHIDSNNKSFNIDGRNLANKSFDELLNESNKCILLCANCHREIHHEDYNLITLEQLLIENENFLKKEKEIFVCKNCGKILSYGNKSGLCSECYIKQSYRTKEKPSKEELENLLKQYSLNKIGKMYGVTHNVVKKWGINYNLIKL